MNNSLKYSCIFGGGAVRGMAYVGVTRALRELEVDVENIAGSSVGAVFAAFFALDFSTDEMKEIFFDFNFNMFKDINIKFGPDFAFSKGEVFLEWLRELIEKKYYGAAYSKDNNPPVTFADLDKDLYILTSDLNNNVPMVFSKANTPDFEVAQAVKISASLPGLMKPTEYGQKFLVDGDLIKSWPLWKTDSGLCPPVSRILEFRLEGCRECVNIKNTLDYLNSVFSTFSNFCTENVISEYSKKDKFDYIVIDTKDVLLVDFALPTDKRAELMKTGYETTIKYFKSDIVKKKKIILPFYIDMLASMMKIHKYIRQSEILKAKYELLELLSNMPEALLYIEKCFYEEINNFRKEFIASIRKSIFNKSSLINKKDILNKADIIINKLQDRKNELSEYIKKYEV